MIDKLLFLDVDGCLNLHLWMPAAKSCNIHRPAVLQFNRILTTTGCKVVLSSAWRYMIFGGAMTLGGFSYMLRTHGALDGDWLIGTTDPDETCAHCGHRDVKCGEPCRDCENVTARGHQITAWLKTHGPVGRYVVLDDDDFWISASQHPFVQTNGKRGLTKAKADRVIEMMNGVDPT